MDIEYIRELSAIVSKNGLTSLTVSEGDKKVRIEKEAAASRAQPVPMPMPLPQQPLPIVPAVADLHAAPVSVDGASVDFSRLAEVKSPMVGVFYSAPSPESEPYVTIGSKVSKGDVLCIIESMKLMNDIVAEQDGEIVDICIKNGDIVEFEQVLFKMY